MDCAMVLLLVPEIMTRMLALGWRNGYAIAIVAGKGVTMILA